MGCCFDSHPRIDNISPKPVFRYGFIILNPAVKADENGADH
ncbi:MAG: hypothetical protein ACK5GN_12865 [Pseudomonadota bacterium]